MKTKGRGKRGGWNKGKSYHNKTKNPENTYAKLLRKTAERDDYYKTYLATHKKLQ